MQIVSFFPENKFGLFMQIVSSADFLPVKKKEFAPNGLQILSF